MRGTNWESEHRIGQGLAPSYFVECLLYNAPDSAFQSSFQGTYRSVVNWLVQADLDRLVCQNVDNTCSVRRPSNGPSRMPQTLRVIW